MKDRPTMKVERDGPAARLILDRPERLNAITLDMGQQLQAVLADLAADSQVRVLVVTGAGRAFSAGGDFDEMQRVIDNPDAGRRGMLEVNEAIRALHEFPLPTVAAINGDAYGGGACLALACDLRLASDRARMGFVFHRVALCGADAGASWLLPRVVGYPTALELLLEGRIVAAEEAQRLGLVSRVVRAEELEATTAGLAGALAAGPSLALRATKQAVREGLTRTFAADAPLEAEAQLACFLSEDFREGIAAYSEKRKPWFKGC